MSTDYKFEGWLGKDKQCAQGQMEWGEFEPKTWEEHDVDIKVECCGVCGSDVHTLSSGWEETPYRHEIIGRAVRVGTEVENIKVGDRVGVGAQAGSCLKADCSECSNGLEAYCMGIGSTNTYGSIYPNDMGKSYGGYSTYNRTHSHFVFKIPDGLESADAAPMLCAGATVYSPLKQNGCGPGMKVGIVGVGGLGHFAVLFAKALGADEVVGISRKAGKKGDVLRLGADRYIATDDDKDWATSGARSLDLIISTVSSEDIPLDGYLGLLKVRGTYIQVGLPDGGKLPLVSAFLLIDNAIKIGGSAIGSPGEIEEMLQFAVDKNIKPWVEKRPMEDANQAIVDLQAGKPRYRYVLVNEA
ncbi:NADP-dependent alcohol dehydrogenase VII [Hyphodiscus hymeniophilus]|uniref:alcohol dehydrogenase (NADP(+)) n=1 Tax=Hyphodiscus hymeniophilus TaxID=353542 RepID=A0A9P6VH07_9HELO|nr:NADP-dependent alcohol dehydrogenase VII [Hyphodiscus hymeniophilus]